MRRDSFSFTGRLTAEVITTSGDVELLPGPDGEVVVEIRGGPEDNYVVEMNGSDLIVHPPAKRSGKRRYVSSGIKVHLPQDASVNVRVASGDITVAGGLRELIVASASGDLRVNDAISHDLEVRTASGDLRLRSVGGNLTATTASGDMTVDSVGVDLKFNSASGDARISSVVGNVEAKTVSGDMMVDKVEGHSVRVRTLSGSVRLGIPPGRTVDLDMQTLSGSVTNRLQKGADAPERRKGLAISVKTVSGDLKLQSA